MSKASEWVKAQAVAMRYCPEPFQSGKIKIAAVNDYGGLQLMTVCTLEWKDAIRLRDWLTEMFDEPIRSSENEQSK